MKKKFNLGDFILTMIPIFIIAFWIILPIGVIYLIFHPELIGEYVGRIMNGFK
ncbi:hypothetical protein [Enterococcus devriesei]|uniref:hypothetical protein n=1 Tax=Enterococcus devriesei TaxID=319970 RepID=UPI0028AC147C|nr:hypothetical protein [Enterococcus devriesei]